MLSYILRRILIALPILWGLLTINFILIHAAPGDPSDLLFSPEISTEVKENFVRAYGLDQPLHVQYVRYLERVVFHLDFGYSIQTDRPVRDEILEALPNTLQLSFIALLLLLAVGVSLGVFSAVKQDSLFDKISRITALTFYSMPSFYLGLMLIFLFGGGVAWLNILPPDGMFEQGLHDEMEPFEKLWDRFRHLLLPTLTLGLGSAAGVSRYMRGEMLEVIRQDYIRTARAKGLREKTVIFKHGLRNALLPIITLLGLSFPVLFGGTVIVETVFSWPGIGRIAVEAAGSRNYPMFLAVNLIYGVMVVVGNLIADVLYGVVDPRVRPS